MRESSQVEGEGVFFCDGYALGVGKGVEDREAHVGDGDLSEDAAVDEFDQGVDGGLGMNGDADAGGREVEEPAGFDNLEAFVHHGGGVDGDALSHDPGGMLEGLLGCDVGEVCERRVAEGATGGGEPDLFYFGWGASAHGLMDGVVFGVDGEESYIVLAGGGDDELAGGYEALLVGEAYGLAGTDCCVGGFESGDADDGGDYEVDLGQGGYADGTGGAVDYFNAGDGFGFEAGLELGGEGFGGEGDCFGAPAEALGEGDIEVAARCEGDDLVAVGEGLADGKGAVADGAGRAEDG